MDKELLKILVCPICKGELIYQEKEEALDCMNCKKRYLIKDGIPVMLAEEALDLES